MFPTTPDQWAYVLGACGVRPATAAVFAPAWADECHPGRLRRGEEELDDLLAEALYESNNLDALEENLYYSAGRIRELGATYGPGSRWARAAAQAEDLAGHPEALAEVLYGGRFGNVNPGDGYKYRGMGLPQITFHDNYARLGDLMGQDLVVSPQLLLQPRYAVEGLLYWWEDRIPDSAIDHDDRIRKLVQGSTLGLDRIRKLAAAARNALEHLP
jgi:putative chitinase